MAKLKVKVKTGKQGQKVAEVKPKVKVEEAKGKVEETKGKPKGKPVYRSKAKLNTHLKIGRER